MDILFVSSYCFFGICEKGKLGVYLWEFFYRSVNEIDGKKWNRVVDLEGIVLFNISLKNFVLKVYVLYFEMLYVVWMWYKWLDYESFVEYSFIISCLLYGGNCFVSFLVGEVY